MNEGLEKCSCVINGTDAWISTEFGSIQNQCGDGRFVWGYQIGIELEDQSGSPEGWETRLNWNWSLHVGAEADVMQNRPK